MIIGLTQNKYCQIDDIDAPVASELKWHYDGNYAANKKRSGKVYLHRLIARAVQGEYVDHVNGDKLDNRRQNLRLCTMRQNQINSGRRRQGTSAFKGVCWDARGKAWLAYVTKEPYKNVILGTFSTEHAAALAHDLWAVDIHKEFARTNFTIVA